jgi:hypothetical protein
MSIRRKHSRHIAASVFALSCGAMVGVALSVAAAGAWAQSGSAAPAKPAACIGIITPTVEGVPGTAADAGNGVRDLMASYLQGSPLKPMVLDAKLALLAGEEAKQKGCESLLIATVRRKSSGRGLIKALGQMAGTSSYSLPYGGSAASSVARAATTTGLQAVSTLAQSTKAKDEISLEYRLQSADGHVLFGPRTERQTAKTDGEDLLTPVVARAAEAIARNAAPQAAPSAPVQQRNASDDLSTGATQYLDHLKSCIPYTFKYPHPLVAGFTGENIIKGRQGDKCQVIYLMPNNLRAECEHGPATITRMTSESAYQEARAGEFNFSFSSNSDGPASRECHLFQGGKELPLKGQ